MADKELFEILAVAPRLLYYARAAVPFLGETYLAFNGRQTRETAAGACKVPPAALSASGTGFPVGLETVLLTPPPTLPLF